MVLLYEIRRRMGQVMPQVLAACALAYFAFHAVQGERGLSAYMTLTKELQETRAAATEIRRERERMAHRVELLRPDSLDPDMLEERARLLLDYTREGDVVIFYPDQASGRTNKPPLVN